MKMFIDQWRNCNRPKCRSKKIVQPIAGAKRVSERNKIVVSDRFSKVTIVDPSLLVVSELFKFNDAIVDCLRMSRCEEIRRKTCSLRAMQFFQTSAYNRMKSLTIWLHFRIEYELMQNCNVYEIRRISWIDWLAKEMVDVGGKILIIFGWFCRRRLWFIAWKIYETSNDQQEDLSISNMK